TAPGHAALHTGKVPAESGIWGNEVPDASNGKRVSFLRDETTHLITPEGMREEAGSSAARLRVQTVADQLRMARPDALIVSISLKDRGAIMPGGRHPTTALWFDANEGSFVTSTAFASSFPPWAAPVANRASVEKARGTPWVVGDPEWLGRNVGVRDDAPG